MKVMHFYTDGTFEGNVANEIAKQNDQMGGSAAFQNFEKYLWENYAGAQRFQKEVARTGHAIDNLLAKAQSDQIVVHLGDDLMSLYGAYHLKCKGERYSVMAHRAPVLGGMSPYISMRPMLRRHLVMSVLSGCTNMIVTSDSALVAMENLFPRVTPNNVAAIPSCIWGVPVKRVIDPSKISIIANFFEGQGLEEALFCALNSGAKSIQVVGCGQEEYKDRILKLVSEKTEISVDLCLTNHPEKTNVNGGIVILAQQPNDAGFTHDLNMAVQVGGTLVARREYNTYLSDNVNAVLYKPGNTPFIAAVLRQMIKEPAQFSRLRVELDKMVVKMTAKNCNDNIRNLLANEPDEYYGPEVQGNG